MRQNRKSRNKPSMLFNKLNNSKENLLNSYCHPGTGLNIGDVVVCETEYVLVLWEFTYSKTEKQ